LNYGEDDLNVSQSLGRSTQRRFGTIKVNLKEMGVVNVNCIELTQSKPVAGFYCRSSEPQFTIIAN